jgi:hypothetical protein
VKAGNSYVGDVAPPFGTGIDREDVCSVKAAAGKPAGQNSVFDLNGEDSKINLKDAKIAERLCTPNCSLALCP